MRKLPVYILIDSSESMIGEAIDAVQKGVELMISTLRRDPYALEMAAISIISFNGKATVLTPLTELYQFKTPHIRLGAGTSLGAAFDLLAARIRLEVVKTTETRRGDYRPIVFLLTDGVPTDDWNAAYDRFCAIKPRPAKIYALGCGEDVDYALLEKISDVAYRIDAENAEELPSILKKVFVWISASVQSASQSVGGTNPEDQIDLPENVERVGKGEYKVKTRNGLAHNAFLHAVCAKTRKKSLLRFKLDEELPLYTKADVFPLPEDFDESGTGAKTPNVSTDLLAATIPPCPHCGNGWIACSTCGSIYCENGGMGSQTACPVCGARAYVAGADVPGYDVGTSMG